MAWSLVDVELFELMLEYFVVDRQWFEMVIVRNGCSLSRPLRIS